MLLGLENGQRGVRARHFGRAAIRPNEGPLAGLGHFRDMRAAAMGGLGDRDIAILGQAKAMIDWHQRHGFCARCGARTTLMDAGYRRHCEACGADHFPRTDPVVIMLATHGDACLVGRGKQFPPGMFSALAGFVEPGETIEEAVRRELMEEAGVKIGAVTLLRDAALAVSLVADDRLSCARRCKPRHQSGWRANSPKRSG